MARTVRQQSEALLPAVPELEIPASLDIVQTDWNASLEKKMALMIEKVAATIISQFVLDLKVFIEKKLLGQTRGLDDSQLPDTEVFVNMVRT